ncbi:MAG: peptidoglycan-binding protein, partial [Acidobacteriia bacterium]|nr:peptidoglycan-binding protein [Terriglobia bacterium]
MLAESLQYLKRGSSGDYVRVIQKVLNHYPTTGSVPLATDGIFGPRTEAAVKRFQGRYSLSCDGIVGPLTRAKIFPVGTHQSLCCVTKPYEEAAPRARLGLPTNIVTAPGTVLDEYSNLETEGNSVFSKETASNGGNGSVSLPAFRSGEFDGATFS